MSRPKHTVWVVRKVTSDGLLISCRYNSRTGPVTEEHVRLSPYVKKWLAGDKIDDVYHPYWDNQDP